MSAKLEPATGRAGESVSPVILKQVPAGTLGSYRSTEEQPKAEGKDPELIRTW